MSLKEFWSLLPINYGTNSVTAKVLAQRLAVLLILNILLMTKIRQIVVIPRMPTEWCSYCGREYEGS